MSYPKHIQRLSEMLQELPGIGPRQAIRLAFALSEKKNSWQKEFARTVESLGTELARCKLCFRVMGRRQDERCDICSSQNRVQNKILVVEKESDIEAFERAGAFDGLYHVTGGILSPLEKNPGEKLHLRELFNRIKEHPARSALEVIIATSNTVEGNQTGNYIERILKPLQITITRLGRGLSTGAEIEYADPLTLDAALKNRR